MQFDIRLLQANDYERVHSFQCEYLDGESYDEFLARVEANPDLYVAAFCDGDLAGVCYGHPSNKAADTIQLQGIAVSHDETKPYLRVGVGSAMMRVFEEAVRRRGFRRIDLGCADDEKVERFYLKNGFWPYELVAHGPNHEELERAVVDDYESGKVLQEQLRRKHRPRQVIFIFAKVL